MWQLLHRQMPSVSPNTKLIHRNLSCLCGLDGSNAAVLTSAFLTPSRMRHETTTSHRPILLLLLALRLLLFTAVRQQQMRSFLHCKVVHLHRRHTNHTMTAFNTSGSFVWTCSTKGNYHNHHVSVTISAISSNIDCRRKWQFNIHFSDSSFGNVWRTLVAGTYQHFVGGAV